MQEKKNPCIFIPTRVQIFAYSCLNISDNCIRNREICVSYQLLQTLSSAWFLYSDTQSCATQKIHLCFSCSSAVSGFSNVAGMAWASKLKVKLWKSQAVLLLMLILPGFHHQSPASFKDFTDQFIMITLNMPTGLC